NASKRALTGFGKMLWHTIRKKPWRYDGYGCYCGFGGKGDPVDDLDRCCFHHDNCYHDIQKSEICPFEAGVYVMPYTTEENKPTKCKPASYYRGYGECRSALCECDAVATECFKRSDFNEKYKKYSRNKC
ncbi:unnamed protein product, partial [Pocillopora meandrina]